MKGVPLHVPASEGNTVSTGTPATSCNWRSWYKLATCGNKAREANGSPSVGERKGEEGAYPCVIEKGLTANA